MSNYAASLRTHVGLVRKQNEDSGAIHGILTPDGLFHVWAVADGMGGMSRGDVASATAIRVAMSEIERALPHSDPAEALHRAFAAANRAVFDFGKGDIGTTMTLALVQDATGACWLAHVGDSRAYLITHRTIRQVTDDHSKVGEAVRAGLMTAGDAFNSSGKNVLTRALGTDREVAIDSYSHLALAKGERLLLSSDGLHGLVVDHEILSLLREDSEESVESLLSAALAAGGKDNVTVLIGGALEPVHTAVSSPGRIAVPLPLRRRPAAFGALVAASMGGGLVLTVAVLSGGSEEKTVALIADPTERAAAVAAVEATIAGGGRVSREDLLAVNTATPRTEATPVPATAAPRGITQLTPSNTPTPTATTQATVSPSDTPTSSPPQTPSATPPTQTPTITPSSTPTLTSTPTPSNTPTPTNTPGAAVTLTPTPEPAIPSPTPSGPFKPGGGEVPPPSETRPPS